MTPDAVAPPSHLGRVARTLAWAALGYWGVYALIVPVTTIDSQMYNLARVALASRGGLFNNDYFTSVFHVIFPWSYDVVHLPFLRLGWGYALPSFACMAGTVWVVHRMMRDRFGLEAAWVAVLSLLALPCLAYQGTSTKNDIPILFCGAVWVYARARWRREGSGVHLGWMVLAIGFMTGVKSSGLIYGGILALGTFWELRGRPKLVGRVAGGLLGAVLLFSSVETYVETARIYGHPLGPPPLIHRLSNHDGIRGGLANLIRHGAAGVYVGPTHFGDGQVAPWALAGATRKLLGGLGLTDAGTDPRFQDRLLFFSQSGLEELSGYGPLGTLALALMLVACCYWRPREPWWQLAVAALAGFAIVSLTVAYNSWTNRYLVSFYALGTLALVSALWAQETAWRRPLRWAYLALAGAGMITAPLLSFNRQPADILAAVTEREQLETGASPVIGKAREALRRLRTQTPSCRVYYVVTDESVLLPILEDKQLAAHLVTPAVFLRLAAQGSLIPGDLVLRESEAQLPFLSLVESVTAPNAFSEKFTLTRWIYRVIEPAAMQTDKPPLASPASLL